MQISQRVFAFNTNFSVAVLILSFLLVCHYYRQYRCAPQEGELAQMVKCSLSVREVLGSVSRFSSH